VPFPKIPIVVLKLFQTKEQQPDDARVVEYFLQRTFAQISLDSRIRLQDRLASKALLWFH
jgi:hypothetical protein